MTVWIRYGGSTQAPLDEIPNDPSAAAVIGLHFGFNAALLHLGGEPLDNSIGKGDAGIDFRFRARVGIGSGRAFMVKRLMSGVRFNEATSGRASRHDSRSSMFICRSPPVVLLMTMSDSERGSYR